MKSPVVSLPLWPYGELHAPGMVLVGSFELPRSRLGRILPGFSKGRFDDPHELRF
jgi:hypothetical protein